jgi:hypothetical protein
MFFWFMTELKTIVRMPRPYHITGIDPARECKAEFGDPSSTSTRVATILFSFYFDLIY